MLAVVSCKDSCRPFAGSTCKPSDGLFMGAKTNEPQLKGNTRFSIDASALPDEALPDIFLWLLCSTDACALDEMLKVCPDRLARSLGDVQFGRLDLLSQISIAKNSAIWERASSFFEEGVKSIASGKRKNKAESFQNAMGLLVCACAVPSADQMGTPSPKDSARSLGLCSLAFGSMEEDGRSPGRGPFPTESFWRRLSRGLCHIDKDDVEQATRDLCNRGFFWPASAF